MHWLQHLFSWVRHRLFTAEMVRFIVVGIVATAIHYGVYYLLLGPVGHNIAYTVGYAVSFVANFMLSSLFTFRVRPSVQRFAGFGLSHLLNYVIQIVLLNVFILVGIPSSWAPLPVFVVVVPLNFLLVRFALKRNYRHDGKEKTGNNHHPGIQ